MVSIAAVERAHSYRARSGSREPPKGPLPLSIFWQLDRPCPLSFGQRHFLKPTVRPLKLSDFIHLDHKGVCFMSQTAKPIPACGSGLLHGPLILGHASVSFSSRSRL
jgi:hypothetical protein